MDEERGHDGLTHEERIARFRSQGMFRAIPDPRDAEITCLREALEAAKARLVISNQTIAESCSNHDYYSWAIYENNRDCLAMIEAALGKETGT